MPERTTFPVTIESVTLHNFMGRNYRVIPTTKDRPEGVAYVRFRPVCAFSGKMIYEVALEHDIPLKTYIAQITDFWPNGILEKGKKQDDGCNDLKPFMRQGIGSLVHERIIHDCLESNIRFFYACTPQEAARNFLRKQQFTEFSGESSLMGYFYRLY